MRSSAARNKLFVAGRPQHGDFSDAKVIRKFGDVPNDLSAIDVAMMAGMLEIGADVLARGDEVIE
jgi:hypothetical protein